RLSATSWTGSRWRSWLGWSARIARGGRLAEVQVPLRRFLARPRAEVQAPRPSERELHPVAVIALAAVVRIEGALMLCEFAEGAEQAVRLSTWRACW
ncbi:MAG: hypothetical protein QW394_09650, partial [Thermofilaceae archaeon]